MSGLRVGWDLDGVEYDFAESVRRAVKHFGMDSELRLCEGEPDDWYFYRAWGLSDMEFVDLCHRGADAGIIFSGPARPGGLDAIRRIRNAGHSVHIVTDRSFGVSPSVSEKITKDWLESHGYEYDSLTFSADKTVVPTDFFIEDKIANYDALDAVGTEVYLINRPWNVQKDSRRRVDTVAEFSSRILEVEVTGLPV